MIANAVTVIRILCSIALSFFKPFSLPFYIMYITAGFSDMIDGTVARKMKTFSEFGSKLDTTADFLLVIISFIKLIPVLDIETWIQIWITVITVFKVINAVSGFARYKKIIAVHSALNKITGVLLFVLPLSVCFVDFNCVSAVVCVIATIAAIHEGYYIHNKERKSLECRCSNC
ncbi:MAG: CDP-alcohol phosphatidyltransferase family protein [Treponema sp.]|nr:CDP-alcohol phosphatidyltransferase family protein [Treponema sp.]